MVYELVDILIFFIFVLCIDNEIQHNKFRVIYSEPSKIY